MPCAGSTVQLARTLTTRLPKLRCEAMNLTLCPRGPTASGRGLGLAGRPSPREKWSRKFIKNATRPQFGSSGQHEGTRASWGGEQTFLAVSGPAQRVHATYKVTGEEGTGAARQLGATGDEFSHGG
jgi:hypothetical protein